MSDAVLYEQEGHVVTLTLNRPEIRNAISAEEMIGGIEDALDRINRDNSVRCVIVTGAGTAFSSGGNVKNMKARTETASSLPAQTRRNYRGGIHRIPMAFEALEVPAIAAVNGHAIGAGCDLALMCDIRIAGESAKFAESFVKLGIVSGDGGGWLLPRVVGYSKAAELSFTGDMIDAKEALEIKLVSRVVPDDKLLPEAKALAARIAANPPHALRMTKRLLKEGQYMQMANLLELAAAMQALAHATKDHEEAVTAFVEKRKPVFKGE
jgi:enoyl-CoA hydratase/carnithine racemase